MNLKLKKSDFLMAKRLKRCFAHENNDRSGCMSGIVSIFDFRHGRITRRLLSDNRTHMTESTTGPLCPTSDANSITDSEEMHQAVESLNDEKSETVQTRVRELMEEEMQYDKAVNISNQSFDSHEISIDQQVSSKKTPQYRDLENLMNKLLIIHQERNEEQHPKSLDRSNSLDHERNNPISEEPVTRKNRNFFKRRSKSHECISLYDNDTPLPSNMRNGIHHERNVSHFSFTEIKKKLKNVIGRSPRVSGCREKPVVDGNSGWSSPNRDHFYSERFSNRFRRQDEVSRFCKSERKPNENDEFGDMSDRISNIYVEAKKHLSDLLNDGDEDTELTVVRHSRTLGNLLSLPNYNSRPSTIGPRHKPEDGALTMSPSGNSLMVNESQPLVTNDDHQKMEVSDEVDHAKGTVLEIIKPPSSEVIEVFDVSDLSEEDELSCSPIPSPSGSSLSINRKTKEVESTSDDKTGKPSPVSVLEPLFSDDDMSPARTISRSTESALQPLRIRFEENQETCTHNHVENEESVYEYVEALLLASDLNWDEFSKRWLSSVQILDPSLYHELRIFLNRPDHDQLLLFDTTNEILKEICDRSLGFFPGLSYHKTHICMLPKGMDLINEVWERIESRIYCRYSRSLDQLIKKDLEASRTWMDLCSEKQEIVRETEELVFEDVIDDTVLSLMYKL